MSGFVERLSERNSFIKIRGLLCANIFFEKDIINRIKKKNLNQIFKLIL